MLCVEGGPTGGVARARSRSEPPNNEHTASVATVIHAADGAFDFRDDSSPCSISPNILAEVSKKSRKSEIASRYRPYYIIYGDIEHQCNGEKPSITTFIFR